MDTQSPNSDASERPPFEPRGFCPRCNYRMNPGTCPECGMTVDAQELLSSSLTTPQRVAGWLVRRWKYFCLLIALAFIASILLPGISSSSCVLHGSAVATPSGPRPIEDLEVGDQVICVSPAGERTVGVITATVGAVADEYLEIRLAGHDVPLRVTACHPVAGDGTWRRAGSIRTGDTVTTAEGARKVTRISRRAGRVRVYDLSVTPYPNFFASGVLVHNKSYPRPPTLEQLAGTWIGYTEDHYYFYRLQLGPDGTGLCTREFIREGAELYAITELKLNGRFFEFTLEPVDAQAGDIWMRGWATRMRIKVDVGEKDSSHARSVFLQREEDVLERMQNARDRMNRHVPERANHNSP